jgi:hypothetical protein
MSSRTEKQKALRRERERSRKRVYNQAHYVPLGDARRRCSVCGALVYGRSDCHPQCIAHSRESVIEE